MQKFSIKIKFILAVLLSFFIFQIGVCFAVPLGGTSRTRGSVSRVPQPVGRSAQQGVYDGYLGVPWQRQWQHQPRGHNAGWSLRQQGMERGASYLPRARTKHGSARGSQRGTYTEWLDSQFSGQPPQGASRLHRYLPEGGQPNGRVQYQPGPQPQLEGQGLPEEGSKSSGSDTDSGVSSGRSNVDNGEADFMLRFGSPSLNDETVHATPRNLLESRVGEYNPFGSDRIAHNAVLSYAPNAGTYNPFNSGISFSFAPQDVQSVAGAPPTYSMLQAGDPWNLEGVVAPDGDPWENATEEKHLLPTEEDHL